MSAVIDAAPASAAPTTDRRAAWALAAPALMLFVGVLVIPLAMTVMLSFHDWGQYKGIEPVFILKNWREIATDPYYAEMFWRTFRIALLTTLITAVLGAPEAYILNRMSGRWKSFFLLVILGPLLISVVARTLGWALLFGGNNGLVAGQSTWTRHAASQISGVGLHDSNPALAQRFEVCLRRRVLPHIDVHRRRDHHRGTGRQVKS